MTERSEDDGDSGVVIGDTVVIGDGDDCDDCVDCDDGGEGGDR